MTRRNGGTGPVARVAGMLRMLALAIVGLLCLCDGCATSALAQRTGPDFAAVRLSQFPSLSQRAAANYRDPGFPDLRDTSASGGTERVANLACAATVYTMLARGLGQAGARIDDFYADPRPHGGNGPGAARPSFVGEDRPVDLDAIVRALQSGRPVVLHGRGGPLGEHFVLAVGAERDRAGRKQLIALDPYAPDETTSAGRTIRIDIEQAPYRHPDFRGVVFAEMRVVTPPDRPAARPPAMAQADRAPLERAALSAAATAVFGPLAAPVVVEFVQYLRGGGLAQPGGAAPAPAPPSRFETGRSLGDVAERVLLCFHPTGRFQTARVVERPWRDQAIWNAQSSVLLLIVWNGGFIGTQYQSHIAVIERDDQIRAVIVGQSGIAPRRQCELNQWIDVVRR